ncbi:MAG: CAP domain-containing protein [Planctomycetota bacterium]|nr:MAG: CAP domain-containing protein [Planctomycetota bacterium]
MKNRVSAIFIIALLVMWISGCSGSSDGSSHDNRVYNPGGTTGGTGTGSGNGGIPPGTGDTVPGNVELGLSENPEAPRIAGGTADEQLVAQNINEFRQENGLEPLIWADAIADAERSHAYDTEQLDYFGHGASHDPGNYGICVERGQFLDLPGQLWECGYGGGPANAVSGWSNSPGHRAGILDSSLTYHGVGISTSGVNVFWASLR